MNIGIKRRPFDFGEKKDVGVVVEDKEGECTRLFMYLQHSSRRIRNLPFLVAVADCCGIFWNNIDFIVHFFMLLNHFVGSEVIFPQKLSLYVLSVSPS